MRENNCKSYLIMGTYPKYTKNLTQLNSQKKETKLNLKMGRSEQTFSQSKQMANRHEKIFNITNHQENAN